MRNWLLGVAALLLLGACGVPGEAVPLDPPAKVFVCKYVGTPGDDERLQTGQNPISVSISALKNFVSIGSFFNDEQGRSIAIAFDEGQPEPSPDDCPGGPPPPTTTTSTTSSTTTTTTCPDCVINTVVITSPTTTSTTLPPGVPNTFAVPGGTTTTTTGVTTTTLPGVGTTTTTTAAPTSTAVRVTTTTTAPPVTVPPTGTLPHTL